MNIENKRLCLPTNSLMSLIELRVLCIHYKTPTRFRKAVEEYKIKLWEKYINV